MAIGLLGLALSVRIWIASQPTYNDELTAAFRASAQKDFRTAIDHYTQAITFESTKTDGDKNLDLDRLIAEKYSKS